MVALLSFGVLFLVCTHATYFEITALTFPKGRGRKNRAALEKNKKSWKNIKALCSLQFALKNLSDVSLKLELSEAIICSALSATSIQKKF